MVVVVGCYCDDDFHNQLSFCNWSDTHDADTVLVFPQDWTDKAFLDCSCVPRAMFNREVLNKMKKGAMLVNNARGAIVDVDAVKDLRYMPYQAMTPHISGTTIDAQV